MKIIKRELGSYFKEVKSSIYVKNIENYIEGIINLKGTSTISPKMLAKEVFEKYKNRNYYPNSKKVKKVLDELLYRQRHFDKIDIDSLLSQMKEQNSFNRIVQCSYYKDTLGFKINLKYLIDILGLSKKNYDCCEQVDYALCIIFIIVNTLVIDVLLSHNIQPNVKSIPDVYSKTIALGLIHPSEIIYEVELNVNYAEIFYDIKSFTTNRQRKMISQKDVAVKPLFSEDIHEVSRKITDYAKKPFLTISTLDEKGSLEFMIKDSRYVQYALYRMHNLTIEKTCKELEMIKSRINVRLTPCKDCKNKMRVAIKILANKDYARFNIVDLSSNNNKNPKRNICNIFDYLLTSRDYALSCLYAIMKCNSLEGCEVKNEVKAINLFIEKYAKKKGSFDKCVLAIWLSEFHNKTVDKLLSETYDKKQGYRQLKEIKELIATYKQFKKEYTPKENLLKTFVSEIGW